MKTISQVAKLTGISTRTLQYYDEIGLLKPSDFTTSDYRLYNLEHFSELMKQSKALAENKDEILQKSNDLYTKLTSDMTKAVDSVEIQDIVHEIVEFSDGNTLGIDMGTGYWDMIIETYFKDLTRGITDTKYGASASSYIANALQYYFHKQPLQG